MRNPLRQRSLKFKRSSDANVEGKRNFLGNVTNIDGKLYFYGANWVARSPAPCDEQQQTTGCERRSGD